MPSYPATPPLSASCSSGQHFASGFLQIRSHPRHPCLWLTLPLAGCVEDFHLQVTSEATTAKLVALRATRHAWRTQKKPPRSKPGRPTSQTLAVIEAVPQEFPHVINTQGIHYEVPRTSCKLGHTWPSLSWALPPAHLPEYASLWMRVSSPVRRPGLWAFRMNPARVASPWRPVQNLAR